MILPKSVHVNEERKVGGIAGDYEWEEEILYFWTAVGNASTWRANLS